MRRYMITTVIAGLSLVAVSGCGTTWPIRYRRAVTATNPPMTNEVASPRRETPSRSTSFNDEQQGVAIAPVVHEAALVETNSAPTAGPIPSEVILPDADVAVDSHRALTLAAFEAIALEHNPAIRQASASAHKAMGFRDQVHRRPNPTIGYSANQLADAGTDQHTVIVEQDFVTGQKLQRNAAVLDQEIQSQLWEVEAQRYRVLTDIRQRFYDALAAQRRMELAIEFEKVAEQGASLAQRRVDALEGSRPEVLQSEIQLQQVRVQRAQAEAAFRGAWRRLVALAGVPEMIPSTLSGVLLVDRSDRDWDLVYSELLAVSPELRAAQSRLCRAQANLDRQQAQAIPNLSFMLGAGPDNGTGQGMINAQVGLPIPIHNRNQGNIAAAEAEVCRASQEIRRIEMSLKERLGETSRDFESAAVSVDRYVMEILPKAEENLRLAEEAYQAGQFDFLQVYTARRIFFDANLEYVAAQLNLAQATALLDGQLLSGGLDETRDTDFDSGLRDQALNGQ